MPRFVVLEHDHPEVHWDFMLEHGDVLKTWRLPEFPPIQGKKLKAQALADHRLLYLNYEGPVRGNRGNVVRRDQGTYDIVSGSAFSSQAPGDCLLLSLTGGRLCGLFCFERLETDAWQLEFLGNSADNGQPS
jgi:hypothetical protein